MDDLVVFSDSSELVDVPASERAASKRAALIEHRPDLFYFVGHYIVPFTAIGEDLIVEVASQDIDVSVVEADGVGRTSKFNFIDEDESVVLEIKFIDIWRLLLGVVSICSTYEEQVSSRN